MPAGRKPRPTGLKLLAGEKGSKINFDEPQPEPGVPACPTSDPVVTEIWDYTAKVLKQMNVLTVADRDVLLAYCQQVAIHRRAGEVLATEGTFNRVLGGTQPHPAIRVQKEAAAMIRSLASEFGLTPAARSRIKVGDSRDTPRETSSARLLSG